MNQLWGCAYGIYGIPQVTQVHISPDGSVFKGLQQEVTNNMRVLLLYYRNNMRILLLYSYIVGNIIDIYIYIYI